MTLPIGLTAAARAEFDDAIDWYENQRPGEGARFATRVRYVFDRIAANPRLHAVVYGDVRRAVVAKYPYNVFYLAEPGHVQVIAVFHTSRDPADWQARVPPP